MLVAAESVLDWRDELTVLTDRLGALFVRPEPRRQTGLYLEGLLGGVERKNGWQLAEQIGDARPWRTQRVLSHVQCSWLRVSGTAKRPQIDQGVGHQLHAVVALLFELEA
jgi:hypothetical protein